MKETMVHSFMLDLLFCLEMPPRRSTSRARTSSTKSGAKKTDESPSRSRSRTRTASSSRKGSVKSGAKKTPKQVLDNESEDVKPVARARPVTRSTSRSRRDRSASPSPAPQPLHVRTRSRSAGRNGAAGITPAITTANVLVVDEESSENTLTKRSVVTTTTTTTTETVTKETSAPVKKPEIVKIKPTEFGGPIGNLGLIAFSHFIVPYIYLCLNHNNGSLILPSALSVEAFKQWGTYLCDTFCNYAAPTTYAFTVYWVFQVAQILMAVVLPGVTMEGLSIASEGGRKLKYLCNALSSWYVSLILVFVLHWYNIFPITEIIDNLGPLTMVSMISADVIAVLVYLSGFVFGLAAEDRSGNVIYDFFMGTVLNPRLGSFDIKMFAEVRVSWIMLFLITVSSAVKQFQLYGFVSYNMAFMIFAHFMYTNAIMKGEDCIPTSWDIFHEKWGWMLAFWNLSGVAFVYATQSIYAFHHSLDEQLPLAYYIVLAVVYLAAYYVFDTANGQKNRFRMVLNGTNIDRPWALPHFEFGTLRNPKYIVTKAGTPLLVDGWFKYARKFHYTVDVIQALCWGLSCGFNHFLPYFYVCFFTAMIVDRIARDERRMQAKYGEDWDRYVTLVPYRLIPGVY